MQRDDTGLDDRAKPVFLDRSRRVDLFLRQKLPQLAATAIFAEHPDYGGVIDKLAQVPGNVGRASWVKRFPGYFYDGDRRLRRDAADLSPDKFVKHQIADNYDSFRSRALEDLFQAVQVHGDLKLGFWQLTSLSDLRLERVNEIGAGISCVRREFRLRFAPLILNTNAKSTVESVNDAVYKIF